MIKTTESYRPSAVLWPPVWGSPVVLPELQPIPYSLWLSVVKFLSDVWDQFGSEAVVRLYYHEQRGWAAAAHPQTVSCASAEDTLCPVILEQMLSAGYEACGTIHSHGSMEAFSSGTDIEDEREVSGVHIVIGRFDSDKLDLHAVASMRGNREERDVFEFLEPRGGGLGWVPEEHRELYRRFLTDHDYRSPELEGVEFDPDWMANVARPRCVADRGPLLGHVARWLNRLLPFTPKPKTPSLGCKSPRSLETWETTYDNDTDYDYDYDY